LRHQSANQAKTRLRFLSHLDHLTLGQPPFLTVRSPKATGLASSLVDYFFSQSSDVFFEPRRLGSFSRDLPFSVNFPLRTLFVRFLNVLISAFNFF
jgi:hypothetical protein